MTTIPTLKEAQASLGPEEYRTCLQAVSLKELALDNLTARLDRDAATLGEELQLRVTRDVQFSMDDPTAPELYLEYELQGLIRNRKAVSIKASYRLVIESEEELPDAFVVIYGWRSADMQAWPFVRELAYSLTSRMGVPRLTLPLLLSPGTLDKKRRRPSSAAGTSAAPAEG